MVRVSGDGLSADDRLFIRYATKYTLDYLLPNKEYEKASVCIRISPPRCKADAVEKIKGTCIFRDKNKSRMRVDVWCLDTLVKWGVRKNMFGRFEEALPCLMHELMHVKQYLSGELVDVSNTKYRYRGRIFNCPEIGDLDGYYNQPFEVQAYGHESHLVERFKEHWIELAMS